MPKNVYYRYNPETDNFERVYPSLRTRLLALGKTCGLALLFAVVIFIIVFYCFDSPTEANLKAENAKLRRQYSLLNKRIDNSMKILARIQERDDNFYRVMMQMEPMTSNQRLSGLENSNRYNELKRLNDAGLVASLSQNMDLLERQLYAQVQSFDQLRDMMDLQEEKLAHIPSVLPLKNYSIAAGYGYRRDPVNGLSTMHEGLDFAAPAGTSIYATGDG
ncbi:MAG: M23 family peptidase, partial [Muribaculaceae bacterium]|nr:M23 family peptidase [Muribaculaceae bacterium]